MSQVLQRLREKYPVYADVPDDKLALAIADKFPQYLEQEDFKSEVASFMPPTPAPESIPGGPTFQPIDDELKSDLAGIEQKIETEPMAKFPPEQDNSAVQERMEKARGIDAQYEYLNQLAGGDPSKRALAREARQMAMQDIGITTLSDPGAVDPLINMPRVSDEDAFALLPDYPKAAEALAGAQRGVVGLVEFFTSPLGIATLGLGALPVRTQRMVAGTFAVDMATHTPEIARELATALGEGNIGKSVEFSIMGAGNLFFTKKSAEHAMTTTPERVAAMKEKQREQITGMIGKELLKMTERKDVREVLDRLAKEEALEASLPRAREEATTLQQREKIESGTDAQTRKEGQDKGTRYDADLRAQEEARPGEQVKSPPMTQEDKVHASRMADSLKDGDLVKDSDGLTWKVEVSKRGTVEMEQIGSDGQPTGQVKGLKRNGKYDSEGVEILSRSTIKRGPEESGAKAPEAQVTEAQPKIPSGLTRDEFFDAVTAGTSAVRTIEGKVVSGADHADARSRAQELGLDVGPSDQLGQRAGWIRFGKFILAKDLDTGLAWQRYQREAAPPPGKRGGKPTSQVKPEPTEVAPVRYEGPQGDLQLYTITAEIPGFTKGSTVTRASLEKAGYKVPESEVAKEHTRQPESQMDRIRKQMEENEAPTVAPRELPAVVKEDVQADPRLDEPGITRKTQPNSIVVQLRDLESNPVREIVLPSTGDPLVDSKTIHDILTRQTDGRKTSRRESIAVTTGPNGLAIYHFAETPRGIAWTTAEQLVGLRRQVNAPEPSPQVKPPELMTPEEHSSTYKVIPVDSKVDGRTIRNADKIPNMSSIDASLDNPQVLPGIREVPMSDFTLTGKHYSVRGQKNIDALAEAIRESGEITPLIVVRDKSGAYILEGATRAEALKQIGAKSFPAKVVLDLDSIVTTPTKPPAQTPVPKEQTTVAPRELPAKAKEPWEMTREEVVQRDRELWREMSTEAGQQAMLTAHRFHVRDAIREGKPVPPEVLKDYPDLAPPSPKAESTELISMGADVLGAGKPSGKTQSALKNEMVEQDRTRMGLPKFEPAAREDYGAVWDEAMSILDRQGPAVQDTLIAELKAKPRALKNAVESALLHHRLVDLKNEYAKATRDLAQAHEDGRIDDVSRLKTAVDTWSDKVLELTEITKAVGREWGRTGVARQQLANDDFSLAGLELRKRAAKGGRRLTEEERSEIQQVHADYQNQLAKLNEHLEASRQREAESNAARVLAEARQLAETPYSKVVLDVAEKWVKQWELAADKARKELAGKFLSPTPKDLLNLAIVARANMAEVGMTFAKWSSKMISELGPGVQAYLQGAWDKARSMIDEAVAAVKDHAVAEAAKRKVTNQDATERQSSAVDKISAKVAKGELSEIFPHVQSLVRAIVEQKPDITREQLVDAVHSVLEGVIPGISKLDAMDAISGRGRFWTPPQDAVSKTVRDLKQQIRLVGHQIDVEARRPLPRTGYQREKMSDAARREEQRLEDLKRRFGVVVTDPATQLASALQARKTYYTNRLSDLNHEIATRKRIVRERGLPPTDAKLEALRAEYAKVKEEHSAIFPKDKTVTEAQRIAAANRGLDRAISKLEAELEAGKLKPDAKTSKTPETPEILEKRAWLEALREHRQELRDLADPKKTPEQRALQARKAYMATRAAELQQKLSRGDFSTKPRKQLDISKDPEAMRLQSELETVKREFEKGLLLDQAARRSRGAKIYAGSKEALNLPRAVLAAFDVSAVLRQGGFIVMAHPVRGASSVVPMFRALVSEKAAFAIEQSILSRPNAGLYARSKLYLASLDEFKLSRKEELMMSQYANAIPGVRASNRAFMTFLNKLRADSFDQMVKALETPGKPLTQVELEAIANYINVATGRGNIRSSEGLATVFFSPRLVASRFQLLAGQPFYHGSKATRVAIVKEYARMLGGLSVVYALGSLAMWLYDDEIEIVMDPTSADFGKLRFGDARVDPLMGLAQSTVLLSRLSESTYNVVTGQPTRYKWDTLTSFLRSKLSPTFGASVNLFTGTTVVGDKVTPELMLQSLVVPLSFQDIYDVMKDEGVTTGTALGILSMFGMSVQHYSKPNEKGAKVNAIVNEYLKASTSEKDRAEYARRVNTSGGVGSDYKEIRMALHKEDFEAFSKEYEKLIAIKGSRGVTAKAAIRNALNPKSASGAWSPITGLSKAKEDSIVSKMTPEEREMFNAARQERKDIYDRFIEMRRRYESEK